MSPGDGLALVLAHGLPLLAGSLVVEAVAPRWALGRVERLALGFATGWGILAFVQGSSMMAGGDGSRTIGMLALLAASLGGAGGIWRRAVRDRRAAGPGGGGIGEGAADRAGRGGVGRGAARWWRGIAGLVIAGAVLHAMLLLAETVSRPVTFGDPMLLWIGRAHELFYRPDLAQHVAELRAEATFHPEYPLLVPLAARWVDLWLGRTDDLLVMTLFAGWLAAFLGLLACVTRRLSGSILAAGLLVFLASGIRPIRLYGTRAFADLPLGFAILASAWLLFRAVEASRGKDPAASRRWIILASMLAAAAAMTKNEGVAALVGLAAAAAAVPPRGARWRARLGWASPFAVAFLLAAMPWLFFTRHHGLATGYFEAMPPGGPLAWWGRVGEIARAFGEQCLNPGWGLLYAVGILSWLRRPAWRDPALRAFSVPWVFLAVSYAGVFCLTPVDLEEHLRTALDRLLLQVFPLVVAGIAAWWGEVWGGRREGAASGPPAGRPPGLPAGS